MLKTNPSKIKTLGYTFISNFIVSSIVILVVILTKDFKINYIEKSQLITLLCVFLSILFTGLVYKFKNKSKFALFVIKNIRILLGFCFLLLVFIRVLNYFEIYNFKHYGLLLSIFVAFISLILFIFYKEKKFLFNLSIKTNKNISFIIFIFFSLTTVSLPILYNGAYMDEFTHVFSGISLLENGTFAEIYEGGSYLRGSYVSVIAAVIFLFFGEDIIYLKFAIALIGVLNLYLLYRIANIFFKNTLYSSLAILLYGISPLVLFNHFYIRQYIFYELFILLILAVAIKIINLEYEKDYKRSNYYILLFIVINIFIFFTSYDAGRIMMAFYSSILASYCYIAVFNRSKLQYKSLFDSLLSLNLKTKTILVGLSYFFSATIVIILTITGIINLSEITYSSPEFLKYDNLFFNLNLFATTFFLISLGHLLIRWEKYEHSQRIIIISASVLLILNLLLPNDLQNTRSILYIFPIFYIVVTAGVETLSSYSTKKILKPFLVIILLIEVIVSYPPSFIKSPHIPGEIDYIDLTVYQDTLQLCKQSLVLVYSNPGISDFMGIRPDYYLNSKYDNPSWISENPDNRMVKFRQGIYYDTYSNVPLITNVEKLKLIYSTNENICLIQGGLPYSWLNFEMRDFVRENFTRYEITYLTNQDYKRMILYTKHD